MEPVISIPAKFAQRLAERYSLSPPVDVRSLLSRYAEVTDRHIPIDGVDGVCLDLKVPGRKTRVIINLRNPPLRRRFTEAHELGHIIIPWHKGTIVDDLDASMSGVTGDYWTFEDEANQFAAELLMPSAWMVAAVAGEPDLALLHQNVCVQCSVSALAASRRLATLLPTNIAFVCERDGVVEFSGKTEHTLVNVPSWGRPFDKTLYLHADNHYATSLKDRRLHWWTFPSALKVTTRDPRPWRDVLDIIVADLGVRDAERSRFKMSVNGVLAAANSVLKTQGKHSREALVAACLQRFNDRNDLLGIADHPLFMDFVVKRAEELTR